MNYCEGILMNFTDSQMNDTFFQGEDHFVLDLKLS